MRLRITKQRRAALEAVRACADIMLSNGEYSDDEEISLKRGIELIDWILVTSREPTRPSKLCPNCGLTTHTRCCAQCGKVTGKHAEFCSMVCRRKQREQDRISDAMERNG